MYSGSSPSTYWCMSVIMTENPARKHFSLVIWRIWSIAPMVWSEAAGASKKIIIIVEDFVGSSALNMLLRSSGSMLTGSCAPIRPGSERTRLTPGTSSIASCSWET